MLYNGNPLTDYTDKTPSFWTREENTNATRETGINLGLAYDNGTGAYILGNFESGKYGIQVSLDNDGNGYPFPNDFYGWISPIYIEEGGVTVERDLTVKRNLHLTSPADNKSTLGRTDDPKDIYQGEEVKIEWDPLPEAIQYRLSNYLYQESPYQRISTVVNQVTSETAYIVSLPASDDGQFYQISLYADNADTDMVGQLMINYENGLGWDYRFRTVSVPTPNPTATPTPNDTTPPVVTGVSVNPQVVDVSEEARTIQVIYTATDDISGVAHTTGYVSGLVFTSPSGSQTVKINASNFVLTSGTVQDGQHSATATFPQFAESGIWQLTNMLVEDGAGNLLSLGSAAIENLGLNVSVVLKQGE